MKITQEQKEKGQALIMDVINKAWEDSAFKKLLIEDPLIAIRQVVGENFKLPENKKIVVVDQMNDDFIYLNLPSKPNYDNIELSDEQLEMVAGGEVVVGLGLGFGAVGLFVAGYYAGKAS